MKNKNVKKMALVCLAASVIVVGTVFCLNLSKKNTTDNNTKSEAVQENNISENTEVQDTKKTITISSLGNMMFHDKQIIGARTDEGYDFLESFKYIKDDVSSADIGIGIFEGTLAGGTPAGYPFFNSPDSAMDSFKNTGIDIINIASNHIFDKGDSGFLRTIKIAEEKGLEVLGVHDSTEDKKYIVKEIDGVKIGFISYAYETYNEYGQRTINGNVLSSSALELINVFDYNDLESFYTNIKEQIDAMKLEGVNFVVTSMHWGEEYDTTENMYQSNIAEELNKLGVDIILGGHPHVIQPFETITSESGHETFVLYSQGNMLSNQCEEEIGIAHSEDGILVNFTLEAEGENVSLKKVEVVPTWVYREKKDDGTYCHRIIPVNDAIENKEQYNLTDTAYERIKSSLERTKNIVGEELIIQK